jgi:hypothetical protein
MAEAEAEANGFRLDRYEVNAFTLLPEVKAFCLLR